MESLLSSERFAANSLFPFCMIGRLVLAPRGVCVDTVAGKTSRFVSVVFLAMALQGFVYVSKIQ